MLQAGKDGHRVVLVTATRGEVGEISNMDETASRPRLAEIRTEELRRAGEILGVDRQEFLGYRDSGMAGTADNDHPDSFHRAPLHDAASRLAHLLMEERPEVVVTYDPTGSYFHPDHIKAHEVTTAALDMVKAQGWEPAKYYWHAWPREGLQQMGRDMAKAGRANPWEAMPVALRDRLGVPADEVTTVVDVRRYIPQKRAAFSAHVSQNAPDSFFLSTPAELFDAAFGTEHYVLVRGNAAAHPEHDLFQGVGGNAAG